MEEPNHEALIQQFNELTGAAPAEALQYLTANRWDLSSAAAEYFTSQDEKEMEETKTEDKNSNDDRPYTGPRTLDGRPAAESAAKFDLNSRASAPPKKKSGIATLDSLNQEQNLSDNFDDSDDEDFKGGKEPRDLFAGGEKSGLAVQDPTENYNYPKKLARDILKMAKANAARLGGEPSATPPSKFRGNGQTLGGDDTPSRTVPNPEQKSPELGLAKTKTLHLWNDGFSIEEGPLRRFDDPQNAADLQMIRQGRAPVHLMGVRHNQPIDVQLIKHDENYKAPPKKYVPFSGTANRLGSPVPGSSANSSTPTPTSIEASTPEVELDPSQSVITLRIQLANGTRLPVRFNPTHTVGHIYSFIERAIPGSDSRPWVLATTFPNKNHTEKTLTLGEVPEFKKGGTAIQKVI